MSIRLGQRTGRQAAKTGSLFGVLAWVQGGLLLDLALDSRWMLHAFWVRQAMSEGVYDQRGPWQLFGLIGLGILLTCCCAVILHGLRRQVGASLAATGTLLSTGLCCAEAVSFHAVDGVLYHEIGGMMIVSFIWLGLALFTCWGVWLDDRSYQTLQRG